MVIPVSPITPPRWGIGPNCARKAPRERGRRERRHLPLSSEHGTHATVKSSPDSGLGFQVKVIGTS
jgi:hypothetical protein